MRRLLPSPTLSLVLGLATATVAHAQPDGAVRRPVVVGVASDDPEDAAAVEAWQRRLLEGPGEGTDVVPAFAGAAPGASRSEGVAPDRLAALGEVESLLVRARALAAHLEDAEALALLARALRIVESHADLPGAAAWLAEVHTALALVAAQAGRVELMEASFARAATLDPRRVVGAAEARPEVVERARAIARDVATRTTGRFRVRCAESDAVVFLDDRPQGPCGSEVRASVGRHVLRVGAPGRVPYGALVDVFAGERAEVAVVLSPLPEEAWLRAVVAAGARFALAEVVALFQSPPEGATEAWLVEASARSGRALLTVCDDRGCSEPHRLAPDEPAPNAMGVPRAPAEAVAALADARAWLDEAPRRAIASDEERPWYRRWYVWVPVTVAVAALATGVALAARPEPERQLEITIDFGDLGGSATAP